MNRTHYLVYFDESGEMLITTDARNWNRAFPHHLNNPEARTSEIEIYLVENFQFERSETDRAVIYFKWEAIRF